MIIHCNLRRQKCDQERRQIIFSEPDHMWNVKLEIILGNNEVNWNNFKITQKIPKQHTWEG
jgi:hypothetical protein